MSELWLYIFGS